MWSIVRSLSIYRFHHVVYVAKFVNIKVSSFGLCYEVCPYIGFIMWSMLRSLLIYRFHHVVYVAKFVNI